MEWWIKLHRKILDNAIWKDYLLFSIMCYMLLSVSHKRSEFYLWNEKIILEPWQWIITKKKIAEYFKKSIWTIFWKLNILKSENIIEIKSNNKYTIITFKNWDIYQLDWNQNWKQNENKMKTKWKQNETFNNDNNNILSKDNIIYIPKNNFDYYFVEEFLNKEHPTIKYQIEKYWLNVYLWKQYEVVDKLIKDWFTLEQIQLVCLFIKQDDFWKNNILTIKKLHQKNKDWVPYIVVILWKAKDFIEKKQERTYQKTFLYGNWKDYVSN